MYRSFTLFVFKRKGLEPLGRETKDGRLFAYNASLRFIARPTVHTNPSRKRSFEKALLTGGILACVASLPLRRSKSFSEY